NEDYNFDLEADLRKIEYLLNQDPSTESEINIIDLVLERFTDKPALDYSLPLGDDDDDLFDFMSDNDKWEKLLYGPIKIFSSSVSAPRTKEFGVSQARDS
nr:hypothetical protein [Tanacetum cinerariifolium]